MSAAAAQSEDPLSGKTKLITHARKNATITEEENETEESII